MSETDELIDYIRELEGKVLDVDIRRAVEVNCIQENRDTLEVDNRGDEVYIKVVASCDNCGEHETPGVFVDKGRAKAIVGVLMGFINGDD